MYPIEKWDSKIIMSQSTNNRNLKHPTEFQIPFQKLLVPATKYYENSWKPAIFRRI